MWFDKVIVTVKDCIFVPKVLMEELMEKNIWLPS